MSNNFHLQLYRGTTAQNNAYTGPAGELTVDTQTNNIRLHDGSTAGGVVIGGMPTGSIIPFGGSTAPDGYLLCDGSAVSRSTYSALFAVIGTTYGPGDGNSTFNLPTKYDCGGFTPSNITDNLTIKASGSTYIAPANGYFSAISTSQNKAILLVNESSSMQSSSYCNTVNGWTRCFIPAKKGQIVTLYYDTNINFSFFIFTYITGQISIIKY